MPNGRLTEMTLLMYENLTWFTAGVIRLTCVIIVKLAHKACVRNLKFQVASVL